MVEKNGVEKGTWEHDYSWDPEDDELADQWESAQVFANNFGLWLAGRTYSEREKDLVQWLAFASNFDPQAVKLLEYTMAVAFANRAVVVRNWN